jgi:hypothetical protein
MRKPKVRSNNNGRGRRGTKETRKCPREEKIIPSK